MEEMNERDLFDIGQQLEMRDKLVVSRSSLTRRMIEMFASWVNFVFGIPIDSDFANIYRAKKWINACLQNYLKLLKQLDNIRKARDDFTRMKADVEQDKDNLNTRMKKIHETLVELRQFYLSQQSDRSPTTTLHSDISLALADYERYNNLYCLYNDILALTQKTLVETERIEKLANLCGVINNSSFFSEPDMGSDSFENTLYDLLGYVARCDKTKDYITSQLTLAKSSNVDDAMKMGTTTESLQLHNRVERFVDTGDVSLLDSRQHLTRRPTVAKVECEKVQEGDEENVVEEEEEEEDKKKDRKKDQLCLA
jgi:hypothetical protein